MTRKKTIVAFVALAATVALVPAGAAFAFGGGMGGGGFRGSTGGFAANPSGSIGSGSIGSDTIGSDGTGLNAVSIGPDSELPIAGRVATGSTLPQGATLVRLRVNGRVIPMALDTKEAEAELGANPTDDYNKALYNSVLKKQMVVIGNAELCNQIAAAADSSKPLVLQGYVFDHTNPYFVVRSASDTD
jgi:hypothetical protein